MTIIFDTWPKTLADTAAWTGFAKAKVKSNVTRVGPEAPRVAVPDATVGFPAESKAPVVECGDWAEAGWNRHTVSRALKSGVDDAATA